MTKRSLLRGITLCCVLLIATTVVAQDKPKNAQKGKGRNPAASVLKQLGDLELTEEQTTKITAMAKESVVSMRKEREEAGLTTELMQKRTKLVQQLVKDGKKNLEAQAAANKELKLTEAQVAALKKSNGQRMEMMKKIVALLTDEQKAKLPQRLQGRAKPAKKGKKKPE